MESGELNLPPPSILPFSDIMCPYYFVGDNAFPLKPYLLRPYPGSRLPYNQDVFNYRLSRARRTIENSFGILSSRWRVLQNSIIADVDVTERIVGACICLHNYLRLADISAREDEHNMYAPNSFIDEIDQELVHGQWQDFNNFGANNPSRQAQNIRDTLADYVIHAGAVSWQNEIIFRGSHPQ